MSDYYPPAGPGPSGPSGWNPPTPPPPPRKRNWFLRHKVLTALAILLALVIVGAAAAGGSGSHTASSNDPTGSSTGDAPNASATGSTSKAGSSSAKASKPAKKRAGIGTPVQDGDLRFTVTKVRTGVASVGDQYLGRKAQGRFVLISVTVTNTGKESRTLSDSEQKVKDTQGRTFKADSEADIYITDNQVLFQGINPGNSVRGVFAFDMPLGSVPASIELHNTSFFSDGATVQLR